MDESLREDFLELKPLSQEGAKTVATHLIETGPLQDLKKEQKEQAAAELSSVGSRYPVWIVMAVRVLEKERNLKNLPITADDIAKKYVDEVIEYFLILASNSGPDSNSDSLAGDLWRAEH